MTLLQAWHPAGVTVANAQGVQWVRLALAAQLGAVVCALLLLGPSDALQAGRALAPVMTVGTGLWGCARVLFANFVYCLIRKTRLVLANSGSSHIWGKGVTWIWSRTQF